MSPQAWQFFIDVGGTFTDVVARRPDGTVVTHKLLSTGVVRGVAGTGSTTSRIRDGGRIGDPEGFWTGYEVTLPTAEHDTAPMVSRVTEFNADTGELVLDAALDQLSESHCAYDLHSGEQAPVVAIRYLMGLGLKDAIGPIDVRLGSTRATNALLERTGAKVALVTTLGFADVLKIGNQDRPELFDLNIRKRDELTSQVVEIDERLTAAGDVLKAPDNGLVRRQLEGLRASGIESVAICLMHAHTNPVHEEEVAGIAENVGFGHVSVSSRVARLEKIVPRGDTTVVDAYLSPVIRGYVDSLRRSMPEARLQLMTSSGGLVDAAAVSGKDTVLSGPAGGVVGCAHVARRAGFDKTIGFDMGGTSTDVSRIDSPPGTFEYQHETVKAGVRIMTPMLAVETVAAGGGSLCGFDGQKLTVGPRSAGAEPGPASYGRGGPLTVTDMNVVLGRVVPEHFPFSLDRTAVERKLALLGKQIHASTDKRLDPIELATGFIRIANAKMATAIKRISIAKGVDVRDYVLTTFGGAGAQHACAIARSLGMSKILCHPYAGVLSALGIGVADIKRISQRGVHEELNSGTPAALEPGFAAMTDEVRRALLDEGVHPASLESSDRTMDLCYTGQATFITISAEPISEARKQFEREHRRLYGYAHEGRAIEVRVIRVELRSTSEHIDTAAAPVARPPRADRRTTPMIVEGRAIEVPLFLRSELEADQLIAGPAVIIEDTSTIVVDPGWEAVVTATGDIVMTDRLAARPALTNQSRPASEEISTEADPIELELFNNQFAAIAEQMGTTLRRTALSTNVKERLDFSCAIFTPDGDLVVNAPHIPVHLGAMSECVKALMEDVPALAPGDVYITNDPYRGGSHLNDVTVITPMHDEGGQRILFFVASRAHHAEIGGTTPGSMPPDSTCLAQEGVVIRAFPWVTGGAVQQERLRALLTSPPYPSRSPDENLADVAAQAAANQTGVRELRSMIARHGVDVVHGYMRHIQTAAERKMRAAISKLPDGVRRFEDGMDPESDAVPGPTIRLAVTIAGDSATLDFSGTDPVLPGNLNANRAIVTSAALYCFRCLIDEDIPLNAGVLVPIRIILPPCFLSPSVPRGLPAEACPAVVGGNVETSQRIVDCIFGALGIVAASQGTMNNLLMGNDHFGYYETICGGAGAGAEFDGADAVHTHMTNTRLTDPEVLENRVPVRLIRFAIRPGSGGDGRRRGGCGVIRELEFLEPLEVSILSQRRRTAPYGLHGGKSGQRGRNLLQRHGSNDIEVLPPVAHFSVNPGDRLTLETPGGGGFGKPDEPTPASRPSKPACQAYNGHEPTHHIH